LTCDYQGDDMQIDTTRVFLLKCWLIYSRYDYAWMCLPNRAGILTPVDGLEEGETVTMLVMPVMLNS
jgi:DNA polymerase-3 subunit beta